MSDTRQTTVCALRDYAFDCPSLTKFATATHNFCSAALRLETRHFRLDATFNEFRFDAISNDQPFNALLIWFHAAPKTQCLGKIFCVLRATFPKLVADLIVSHIALQDWHLVFALYAKLHRSPICFRDLYARTHSAIDMPLYLCKFRFTDGKFVGTQAFQEHNNLVFEHVIAKGNVSAVFRSNDEFLPQATAPFMKLLRTYYSGVQSLAQFCDGLLPRVRYYMCIEPQESGRQCDGPERLFKEFVFQTTSGRLITKTHEHIFWRRIANAYWYVVSLSDDDDEPKDFYQLFADDLHLQDATNESLVRYAFRECKPCLLKISIYANCYASAKDD